MTSEKEAAANMLAEQWYADACRMKRERDEAQRLIQQLEVVNAKEREQFDVEVLEWAKAQRKQAEALKELVDDFEKQQARMAPILHNYKVRARFITAMFALAAAWGWGWLLLWRAL